ncbi:MAG: hypothetical protein IPK11_14470 [Ignavibacteria bacterium]|jgi:hypothetical protein|nr:hypothetical protein [Ignavibacteria bacterium]
MLAKAFFSSKEGDNVPWTENFISVANANLATLALAALDITNVTTKKTDYSTKLNTAIEKQAESKADTEVKNIFKQPKQLMKLRFPNLSGIISSAVKPKEEI